MEGFCKSAEGPGKPLQPGLHPFVLPKQVQILVGTHTTLERTKGELGDDDNGGQGSVREREG